VAVQFIGERASGGTLNPTHSLTIGERKDKLRKRFFVRCSSDCFRDKGHEDIVCSLLSDLHILPFCRCGR